MEKTAHDRQKQYADGHQKYIKFNVGNYAFLKISQWKRVIPFSKREKLSPRLIGTFQMFRPLGVVVYELILPPALGYLIIFFMYQF